MAKPVLTWTITFQPGVSVLSYNAPWNKCTVSFSCDKDFEQFLCRATYETEAWGKDKGTLIAEYNNRPKETPIEFEINANNHLLHEGAQAEGTYRIGMYVKADGEWNLGAYFLVRNSSGGYERFKTKDGKYLVIREG